MQDRPWGHRCRGRPRGVLVPQLVLWICALQEGMEEQGCIQQPDPALPRQEWKNKKPPRRCLRRAGTRAGAVPGPG